MTHFGPPYAIPRNPDELRRLCLKLLRRHWQMPYMERFRDAEDRELGIDLLEISGRAQLSAVRCELRVQSDPLSSDELKNRIDRATTLSLPIGHFVIATTAWRSKSLKRTVFDLNRTNRRANHFTIEVLCWEDIEELLDEYPDVLTEFESTPKRQALTTPNSNFALEPRWPSLPPADHDDPLAREIDEAARLIARRHFQLGRLKLIQLREHKWEQLSLDQRLYILGTLARAWLDDGEFRKASRLFIAARSLHPDDEDTCGNEVLAYQLLGEKERACAMAEALCVKFPKSGRAYALWLSNISASVPVAELEKKIPALMKIDGEVAMVMALRSMAESDCARARGFARKAADAMHEKSDPWLVLGQSILLGEIETGTTATSVAEHRVREAEGYFTRAIALAQEEASIQNEVQALLARAQARIALRDSDGAGHDIENAHALERDDSNGLCEYGILLRSRGNLTGAIEAFRCAIRIGGRDDAEFYLAVSLRERDMPGDLLEASELLLRAVRNPMTVPKDNYLFAVGCAVDTFARLEQWHLADSLLSELPANQIPAAAKFTLRACLELSRGEVANASRLADEALGEVRAESSADERRNLAALLHDLGRYSEALIIWESIIQISGFAQPNTAQIGATASDTRRLLECAIRLGRDEVVLEVCRKLRAEGALVEGALEFELEILERNDLVSAVRLLDGHLLNNPQDSVMRLRRSVAARKINRNELVFANPESMPPAREVLPSLGRIAVNLMRESGRPNEALSYAYELLRRNPNDPDAHRAFLSVLGPLGPMPSVRDFEIAQLGCAVCFVDADTNVEGWAILEDAPDADESIGEFGASSSLAKQLRGRRVGDKFQLPEGRFSRRTAIVKRIISKYAHRYQDCLYGWQARFPGLPEIEMVQSNAKASNDTPYILDVVSKGLSAEESRENAHRIYASTPTSIHSYAERVALSDFQAVLNLATRPDTIIKCCHGSEEELEAALTAYDRANSIVLDITAIATLCLLDRLSLLKTWPRRFVISQTTMNELRRLELEGPGCPGTAAENLPVKGLADTLQAVCTISDGAILSTLAQERREKLTRYFGLHGAESIVLAAMPGHLIWTDDRVIANLARNEFGVRRIWTQSALMARAQVGSLDASDLATAGTKLAGWGYTFTTPSIETLMRAGTVAQWDPNEFPLNKALDQFATESVRMSDAVILAAELIVNVYADLDLRTTRSTVTTRLLERLAARPGGRAAIEALPLSLPIRLGLDLIRARELSDAIRGWMAEHEETSTDSVDEDYVSPQSPAA